MASGSDDQTLIIWEKTSQQGGKVFGSDEVNIETWRPKMILRGHEGGMGSLRLKLPQITYRYRGY